MRLTIEKLVYGGEGLARLGPDDNGPGKSVFVPFVLEGEQVEAELIEQRPGFSRARLDRVIEPAADRHSTRVSCTSSAAAGVITSTPTIPTSSPSRRRFLRETLRRTAKIEAPCKVEVHPSPEWNYRNRTRLKVQTHPEFALGYYRFRSHELLPVEKYPIASPLYQRRHGGNMGAGTRGKIPASVA